MSSMFVGIILVLGTGVAVLLVFVVKSFIVPKNFPTSRN